MRFGWIFLLAAAAFGQKQPFDVHQMLKLARIGEPALSPDGQWVAFTVGRVDLNANTIPKQIYITGANGSLPRQITQMGDDNERPRWSPDSKSIYFVSNRGGSSQIWVMNPDGSNPRQISRVSTEASGILISPDGKKIVYLSDVYPECGADDACNQTHLDADAANKVKARIYTSLLYRHWTKWQGKRRQHIFSMNIDGTGTVDLTPGDRDVPPFSLGGPDDYAIAPDSAEVAFTTNTDPVLATSTNSDIYVEPIAGGDAKKISTSLAGDDAPAYSPDGKYLAFRSQVRPGYESDRWRLMVYERATNRLTNLSEGLDRWVESITWFPDSTRIFYTIEDRGRTALQMIPVSGGGSRGISYGNSSIGDVQFNGDGSFMIYSEETGSRPVE
ncbi:MAG: TolB family protein, partial [Bryobacteraceae bacterium]